MLGKRLRRPVRTKALAHMCRNLFLEVHTPPFWGCRVVCSMSEFGSLPLSPHHHRSHEPQPTNPTTHNTTHGDTQYRGLPCTVMVAGFDDAAEGSSSIGDPKGGPSLFWLDTLGAVQKLRWVVVVGCGG